ncbi:MAG: hypothetical protein N3F05_02355 [Candidatus Diapherotrites archaeon]|nr:hypothetical protein [Candidatus Diapherotrites archaeon]
MNAEALNKGFHKGSISIQVMIYIGVALACGIALFWFLQNFFSAQMLFEKMDNDLMQIASRINENCDSNYLLFYHNPVIEEGKIDFNKDSACMENRSIRRCVKLLCGPDFHVSFKLEDFNHIIFEKAQFLTIWTQ